VWQPSTLTYPDAEQVLCDLTRELVPDAFVGRKIPERWRVAIIWNRLGGYQTPPFDISSMQCRVWAAKDQEATRLALLLAGALPGLRNGQPITNIVITGGPTDLGTEDSPMRQLLVDVTMRGNQS